MQKHSAGVSEWDKSNNYMESKLVSAERDKTEITVGTRTPESPGPFQNSIIEPSLNVSRMQANKETAEIPKELKEQEKGFL